MAVIDFMVDMSTVVYNNIFGLGIATLYVTLLYLYAVAERACTNTRSDTLEPAGLLWKEYIICADQIFEACSSSIEVDDIKWLEGRHHDNCTSQHFNDGFYWWCNTKPSDRHQICITTRLDFMEETRRR